MQYKRSVITVALVISGAAQASLLDGKTLAYQWLLPDSVSPYRDSGNYLVGAGVEIPNLVDGAGGSIDIGDTQISVLFTDVHFNSFPFNGFRLNDVFSAIAPITSVAINGASTAAVGPSRVSFDGNNIWVNFESLTFRAGDRLLLDVSAVPEPETYALMLLGLGALAVTTRRGRRRD